MFQRFQTLRALKSPERPARGVRLAWNRLAAAVVAAAVLFLFSSVRAEPKAAGQRPTRELVIQLGDGRVPAPSHVCVIADQIKMLRTVQNPRTLGEIAGGDPEASSNLEFDPENISAISSGTDVVRALRPANGAPQRTPPVETVVPAWRAENGGAACAPDFKVRGGDKVPSADTAASADGAPSGDRGKVIYCEPNALPGLTQGELGILVLKLDAAVLVSLEFAGHVVRLKLTPLQSSQAESAKVAVVGGHYHEQSEPSERGEQTERLWLPLVRRCSTREVVLPDFDCLSSEKQRKELREANRKIELEVGGYKATVDRDTLTANPRVLLPNRVGGATKLVAKACSHAFTATWDARTAPEPLRAKPDGIWFAWRAHCLLERTKIPKRVDLPDLGVSCDRLPDDPNLPPPDPDVAIYRCPGVVSLPTTVRFRTGDTTWQDRLLRPGETLDGYLGRNERFLVLKWWADKETRTDRAARWGDQIERVEVRDPTGHTHQIDVTTDKLQVDSLGGNDPFLIRYVGTRPFLEQPSVAGGDTLRIADPDELVADPFSFGLSLGGGVRRLSGVPETSSTRWNPYGAFEIAFMLRFLRWRLWDTYVDFEFRPGLVITTHAYHSTFDSSLPGATPVNTWEHVEYLRFPLDFVANLALYREFVYLGVGAGPSFTREMFAEDERRVATPITWTLPVVALGVRVSRAFGLEVRARYSLNEKIVAATFDEAGLQRYEEKTAKALFLGGQIRLDDVFGGARLGSTPRINQPQSGRKCSNSRDAASPK